MPKGVGDESICGLSFVAMLTVMLSSWFLAGPPGFRSLYKPYPAPPHFHTPTIKLVVSIPVLAVTLYILVSKRERTEKSLAYATVGTLLGFWFK